jgi:hypothetical protein
MIKIKATDLEILRQEEETNRAGEQSIVKAIANFAVQDKKKDLLIQQLAQTVSSMAIEIEKIRG